MADGQNGVPPTPTTPTSPVLTDQDLDTALEALGSTGDEGDVQELLKMMNENRMISWEEAEQIMCDQGPSKAVKSSLPPQVRPTEPDNETDVDDCINRLQKNDPSLKEVNLNNMKRTPIPQMQRLIMAIRDNTWLEKLSLANTAFSDTGAEPLIEVVENNESLRLLNLETNYLSGDFLARLFKAALNKQTLEEVKVVNQSMNFSTTAERAIIEAINENRGLTKVSIQLRLPEGRHKIENRMIRNGEIRRILRKQERESRKAGECGPGFTPVNQNEAKRKMSQEAADSVKKPASGGKNYQANFNNVMKELKSKPK